MILENAEEMGVELNTPPTAYFPALSCDDIGAISAPTLLVTGELSPRILRRISEELERCLPSAESVVIPNASHGMHVENPEAYNETVLGFLSRH